MRLSLIALSSLFLVACATPPMGPTVQVMPSSAKPFQVFQQEQAECKRYAQSEVAGQADAANQMAVGTVVLGTVLGAALGSATSGRHYDNTGAGGATGAIVGTGIAANSSQNAQSSIQEQYNNAYVQCMYSKGNQVPGAASARAPDNMDVSLQSPPPPMQSAPPPPQAMTVAQAQAKLKVLGFPVGKADGTMGPRTHAELKRFQKSRGIAETGELDADTVAALTN
jgi:hypothetical protein